MSGPEGKYNYWDEPTEIFPKTKNVYTIQN